MSTPSDSARLEKTARAKKRFYELHNTTKGFKKGTNHKGMSKEEYDTIIQRMSAISNNTTNYNNMRFEIKEVKVEGSFVSRLVKRGTNEKIIADEDLFDIIN